MVRSRQEGLRVGRARLSDYGKDLGMSEAELATPEGQNGVRESFVLGLGEWATGTTAPLHVLSATAPGQGE
jgi:hypothetical protein